MATLTVSKITTTKLAQSLASAAGGGDKFPNTGREFLAVRNASGGSAITVTATAQGDPCNRGVAATTAHDKAQSIPSDDNTYLIGPFPPAFFNDVSGMVNLAYSDVTGLTVAVFSLP